MPFWYNLMWIWGALASMPLLILSLVQPKRRATFLHRLGWPDGRRPLSGQRRRPIWIHALSVGEVASAEPIVDRLRRLDPAQPLVFSTSTHTGMQTARRLFADKADLLFYYPYDLIFSVAAVVRRIRPVRVIIVETDLWPNFLFLLQKKGVPVHLVNARLSAGAFRGYRRLPAFTRKVLATFDGIGAQSEADAARFIRLGACPRQVVVTGNLKFDQSGPTAPSAAVGDLRSAMGLDGGRAVLLWGSTHSGEETEGLAVFVRLKARFGDALLIVAPRDPGRAPAIAGQARALGLSVSRLSSMHYDAARARCDVLVVDTLGLLRRLYAVADIAFVGGSLVNEGGHNPLEPAAYARPILFGPDMSDFAEIADQLIRAQGAVRVGSGRQWYHAADALLADPILRERMGRQALAVFASNKGAVDKTLKMIVPTTLKK
jgi:3-deoxy-D-manno-octulosonic-acid transferase